MPPATKELMKERDTAKKLGIGIIGETSKTKGTQLQQDLKMRKRPGKKNGSAMQIKALRVFGKI